MPVTTRSKPSQKLKCKHTNHHETHTKNTTKKKKKKTKQSVFILSLAAEIVSEAFVGYLGDEPKFRLPSRSVSF